MPQFERLSDSDLTGRDLYLLDLAEPDDLPDTFRISSECFVCLLAWDSEHLSVEVISRVAEVLLEAGCVYFCCWGRGCERVHDIVDECDVGEHPDPDDDTVIMTTWHDKDSLDDALYFFLTCTSPDEHYFDRCAAALAVSIGDVPVRVDRIRFALQSPHLFIAEVDDEEDTGAT